MKKIKIGLLIFFGITSVLVGCGESVNPDPNLNGKQNSEYHPNEEIVAFEQLILNIDSNDSLTTANSLFYTRADGASVEVNIFINDKNQTVKMIEKYTNEKSNSICSNVFYLKEGKKFASRELFEEGKDESAHFVERVTYYDENESPIATKQRTAPYEENLGQESFTMTEKQNCSMQRALDVINQNGAYATTFRGFVSEDPYLYIIVGENNKNGYSSSLVVQYIDPTIKKLQSKELEMIGTPLIINFTTMDDGQGYEYQILTSVGIR